MTDQKGFLVYRDIEDTLDAMTDEQAGQLFKGMVRYFNHGEDPQHAVRRRGSRHSSHRSRSSVRGDLAAAGPPGADGL